MEDSLFVFVIIGVIIINALKFFLQKQLNTSQSDDAVPKKKTSPLEEFLQEIAEKVEGKPREVPAWPEEIERPDYLQEMQEYKLGQMNPTRLKHSPEPVTPPPPPAPMPEMPMKSQETVKGIRSVKPTSFKISVKGMYVPGMNFPQSGQAPILRSSTGKTAFDLNSRKKAKKALIAQMVFSRPRAYETSFDNTITS
ncbi:MAG: hypothetical protein JXR40_08490 [Pontiellaceae bacterium]|nr:hypothetical protein [Pontiellaceae bacterium]